MVRRPRGSVLVTVIVALAIVAAVAQMLNLQQGMAGSQIALRQEAAVARHLAEAGLRDALWRARRDEPALAGERSLGELGTYSTSVGPNSDSNGIAVTATGKVPSGATAVLQRSYYIPCYGKPKTTSLLPYTTDGAPISIDEDDRYLRDSLAVDEGKHVDASRNEARIVMKFDTTAIEGKEIAAAKLLMDLKEYDPAMEGGNLFLHYLMQAFDFRGVTWKNANGSRNPWVDANKMPIPGGYYHPQPSATTLITPTKSIYEWEMRELVALWTSPDLSKKVPQHGVIIRTDKTSAQQSHLFRFYPKDDSARKPRLRVTWCNM